MSTPIAGDFDSLVPTWFKEIEKALDHAAEDGWRVRSPIVFEGEPYVWAGEPKMAKWTLVPPELT